MSNQPPIIIWSQFWNWLFDAYVAQQDQEHGNEYVDLYYVADRVCKKHNISYRRFNSALNAFYPTYLRNGYSIALEVDASPSRYAQVARRKEQIVIDGKKVYCIAMRKHEQN